MEHSYIYGTVRLNGELVENLKTKGPTHTDLSGFISSVQEYADSVVTDRCLIIEKYRSAEDEEGNCYDWYVIDKHYCYVDETKSLTSAEQKSRATIDYNIMMGNLDDPEQEANDGAL